MPMIIKTANFGVTTQSVGRSEIDMEAIGSVSDNLKIPHYM